MIIKKFNENWMDKGHDHKYIEAVSNVLNKPDVHNPGGTGAYDKIGEVLGIEVDSNSMIFHEIEEFIVNKYKEMRDENGENNDDDEDDLDVGPGYDMSAPSI